METTLTEQVKALIHAHNNEASRTGHDFNLFTILGVLEKGVYMCRVLAELLSPTGKHRQGSIYLEKFATVVLGLSLSAAELKSAVVWAEHTTTESRRIDIAIKTCERYIPLEVKINAGDQNAQLSDYFAFAKHFAEREHVRFYEKIYFLSNGKDASPASRNGLTDEVVRVTWGEHILCWLNSCIATEEVNALREALSQFAVAVKTMACGASLLDCKLRTLLLEADVQNPYHWIRENRSARITKTLTEELGLPRAFMDTSDPEPTAVTYAAFSIQEKTFGERGLCLQLRWWGGKDVFAHRGLDIVCVAGKRLSNGLWVTNKAGLLSDVDEVKRISFLAYERWDMLSQELVNSRDIYELFNDAYLKIICKKIKSLYDMIASA